VASFALAGGAFSFARGALVMSMTLAFRLDTVVHR